MLILEIDQAKGSTKQYKPRDVESHTAQSYKVTVYATRNKHIKS